MAISTEKEPFIVRLYTNTMQFLGERGADIREIKNPSSFPVDDLTSEEDVLLEPNQIHIARVGRFRFLLIRGLRINPVLGDRRGVYGLEFGGLPMTEEGLGIPTIGEMMSIVSKRNHQRGYALTLGVEGISPGLNLYGSRSEEVNQKASQLSRRELVGDKGMDLYMRSIHQVHENLTGPVLERVSEPIEMEVSHSGQQIR